MSCKLFDLAAFGDWRAVVAPYTEDKEVLPAWRKMLRGSVFLDASGINQAWTDWLNRKGIYQDELVRCSPPFNDCFVYGGFEKSDVSRDVFEFGVQVHNAIERPKAVDRMSREIRDAYDSASQHLACRVWIRVKELSRVCMAHQEIVLLDDDGKYKQTIFFQIGEKMARLSCQWTLPLFAYQLMHCRNIKVRDEPYRVAMPRGKRNKKPKVTYKTICIAENLVKQDSGDCGSGVELSKHVCRGNFAHYTEENKLFGKYVGMFWRPMHIRGNAKHGIVGKEYKIDAN